MFQKINEWMVKCYVKQDIRWNRIKNRLRDERGAGAVEYALVIAVIVVLVVGAATVMKKPLVDFFNDIVNKVKQAFNL